MILLLMGNAHAYMLHRGECLANLVFIGTATTQASYYQKAPGADPQFPNGMIATKFSFSVDRVVVDTTGDTADGVVKISLDGGKIGTHAMYVPEMPSVSTGDKYVFVASWLPGETIPRLGSWAYVPPGTEIPTQSELQSQWTEHCDEQ